MKLKFAALLLLTLTALNAPARVLFAIDEVGNYRGFGHFKGASTRLFTHVEFMTCAAPCKTGVYMNNHYVPASRETLKEIQLRYAELRDALEKDDRIEDNFPLRGFVSVCSIGGPAVGVFLEASYVKHGKMHHRRVYTAPLNCKFLRRLRPSNERAHRAAARLQRLMEDVVHN